MTRKKHVSALAVLGASVFIAVQISNSSAQVYGSGSGGGSPASSGSPPPSVVTMDSCPTIYTGSIETAPLPGIEASRCSAFSQVRAPLFSSPPQATVDAIYDDLDTRADDLTSLITFQEYARKVMHQTCRSMNAIATLPDIPSQQNVAGYHVLYNVCQAGPNATFHHEVNFKCVRCTLQ